MTKLYKNNIKFFHKYGFCIYSSPNIEKKIKFCKKNYQKFYLKKFVNKNDRRTKNICKNFSRDLSIADIYSDKKFINFLKKINISKPIRTSPFFTHLITYNKISKSQFLPFHQDWPSLATSMDGVVAWFNFSNEKNNNLNGLEFVSTFKKRILKGKVKNNYYTISESELKNMETIKILPKNGILIFSTFLPHRTIPLIKKGNKNFWRMGISTRFDNLNCKFWNKNHFVNAYSNFVARNIYKKLI